jgi:CheY-like chemotaxis protein
MGAVSAESGAGEATYRRSSVLIATSDSATRNLLRQILHVGALDVVDAVDGVEAMALARRLDLDLIVLDAFLAVMDGISVCGRRSAGGSAP